MGQQRPKGQAAHISSNALKGQKLLAQGNALGIKAISDAPCKGKSFKIHLINLILHSILITEYEFFIIFHLI